MLRTSFALVLTLVLVSGCRSIDSSVIDTAGIYADLSVEAAGDGSSKLDATMRVGGASSLDYLDLEAGDVLTAVMIHPTSGAELRQVMTEHSVGGATWYRADFATQEADTGFRIEFDRSASGKTSAMSSTTSLPVPFVFSTESGDTSFSRAGAAEFYVLWDPYTFAAGDQLSYEITGSCIQPSRGGISWTADLDSLQLANGFLLSRAGQDSVACEITVALTLSRAGVADPAYGEGGVFVARQVRELRLTANP